MIGNKVMHIFGLGLQSVGMTLEASVFMLGE